MNNETWTGQLRKAGPRATLTMLGRRKRNDEATTYPLSITRSTFGKIETPGIEHAPCIWTDVDGGTSLGGETGLFEDLRSCQR